MRKWLAQLYYSFPVQLLKLHLRSNLVLIGIWIFLVLLLTGAIAKKYGIRYLFLSPEYLGEVDFWSFFFLGLTFGAMVMSWNLTTYLISAHHFPFLASLSRPFTKFCLNNIIIPLSFAGLLLGSNIYFEINYEFSSWEQIFMNALGFFFGVAALVIGLFAYFFFTNKDIQSYIKIRKAPPPNLIPNPGPGRRRPVDIEGFKTGRNRWRVDTYLTESLRPRLVRSVAHYDYSILMRIFKQNHLNALMVQLFSLIILMVLGYLIDTPSFRIPAGASIFLMMSILIAMTGAISYWFHSWRITVIILLLLGVNFLTRYEVFNHQNKAYGLNYEAAPSEYSYEALHQLCTPENVQADKQQTLQILEKWRRKVRHHQEGKPKMVLFAVSGGGLKSAVWSMQVLRHADSLSNGRFWDHTVLMSGASGGMIGTAYYRELQRREKGGQAIDPNDCLHVELIAKDMLNSIAFTIASNDFFLPWAKFEKGGYSYVKDRGYSFEQQLSENVDHIFPARISDYRLAEQESLVPMMFLTPSIVNDGRRLIISPHSVSYMMLAPIGVRKPNTVEIDAVDFNRLFAAQDADNLQFLSALRMNATFPYILPNVHLPTSPSIEVMDAGFRDNFGMKSTIRYLHVFKDWIKRNTSGVILVQVRAFDRDKEITPSDHQGTIESLLNPLGIAGQVISLQNYEHDSNLGLIYDILGEDNVEIVRLTYMPESKDFKAPISFHLTQREYEDIMSSIHRDKNPAELKRLVDLLGGVRLSSLE